MSTHVCGFLFDSVQSGFAMIFDSTLLAALACDIKQLRGERVRDLWQANANTSDTQKNGDANEGRAVYLLFRDATLLIDTHPQRARLHLVQNTPHPPSTPTALTGLLRKTLRGTLLLDVNQWNFDRILHLRFQTRDELGDLKIYTLVAEMMDRRSNLILLDGPGHDGIIMDAVKRLPPFLNRARTILPHRAYQPPPSQKISPLAVSDWLAAVHQLAGETSETSQDESVSANAATPEQPESAPDAEPRIVDDLTSIEDDQNPLFAPEKHHKRAAKRDAASGFIAALRARYCGISPLVAEFIEAKMHELRTAPGQENEIASPDAWDASVAAQACAWFFERAYRVERGDFTPVVCGDQPYPFALSGRECVALRGDMSTHVERALARQAAPELLQIERALLLSHLGTREKLVAAQRGDVEKALRHAQEATTFNHWGQLLLAHIPLVDEAARRNQLFVDVPDDFALAHFHEDENDDSLSESLSDSPDETNKRRQNSDAASLDESGLGESGVVGDEKIEIKANARDGLRVGWARIPIEPKWTAPDNAARLFERYRRARKLGDSAPQRRAKLDSEAQQLALWREQAMAAQNVEALRLVATACGLESVGEKEGRRAVSRSKQQELDARPENKLRRRDFEGWQLWIGRNALENQLLLSKVASPSDVWMHVRGMPSAHVLIKAQKGKTPPPPVLEEGARWVAGASRAGGRNNARDSQGQGERVEIIYTQAKWVRAVKGVPGRVTLQRFETMTVRA